MITVTGMLAPAFCTAIRRVYDDAAPKAPNKDYSGWPLVYWSEVAADPRAAILKGLIPPILHLIGGRQYLDTLILCGLGIGGHHINHADNSRLEAGEWVPNHTAHRSFAAILYLNGDIEGGELVFATQNASVKPEAGLLVAFPAGADYQHEVLPVRSGKRYSVAMWFTEDPKRELRL